MMSDTSKFVVIFPLQLDADLLEHSHICIHIAIITQLLSTFIITDTFHDGQARQN